MSTLASPSAPLPSAGLSDGDIVARVLAGEAHLFELLVRRHNQRLFRVTRAILRSESEAEDAMQEAYVLAFGRLAQFEGRASFSTWLTRIAVNAAFARLRRARRDSGAADLDSIEPEEHPMSAQAMAKSPEDGAASRELEGVLEQAVDALPEHFRTVFVLRAIEELSVDETAECLDLQAETVRTRYFRARTLLQDALLERLDAAARGAFAFEAPRCDRMVETVFRRLGLTTSR